MSPLNWHTLVSAFKGVTPQYSNACCFQRQRAPCPLLPVYIADFFVFFNCSSAALIVTFACFLIFIALVVMTTQNKNEICYFGRWGCAGGRGADEGEGPGLWLCRASKARGSVCTPQGHGGLSAWPGISIDWGTWFQSHSIGNVMNCATDLHQDKFIEGISNMNYDLLSKLM